MLEARGDLPVDSGYKGIIDVGQEDTYMLIRTRALLLGGIYITYQKAQSQLQASQDLAISAHHGFLGRRELEWVLFPPPTWRRNTNAELQMGRVKNSNRIF